MQKRCSLHRPALTGAENRTYDNATCSRLQPPPHPMPAASLKISPEKTYPPAAEKKDPDFINCSSSSAINDLTFIQTIR